MSDESFECDYCEETFYGDRPYLKHLKKTHYNELGSIDKRRVDNTTTATGTLSESLKKNASVLVFGVLIVVAAIMIYFAFVTGNASEPTVSDGIQEPGPSGSVHEHGSMSVTVDGEYINFAQTDYQRNSEKVHFEGGDGETLHLHARGVTIAYTLETLSFTLSENGEQVTFNGETYAIADEDTIEYHVNGEPVDPYSYELQSGDTVEITLSNSE